MFLQVWALLLLAASTSAKSWRNDYVVDWSLRKVGIEKIPLENISFDVDYKDGFSGFVEFHLENGSLANLRRRVRRIGSCDLVDERNELIPHLRLCCSLNMRGLIAKYDVEAIVDGKTRTVPAEVLVNEGSTHTCIDWFFGNCTKCTKYGYRTLNLKTKLIPIKVSMYLHYLVVNEFQKEIVSLVEKEITVAIETTYMPALEKTMAALYVAASDGWLKLQN